MSTKRPYCSNGPRALILLVLVAAMGADTDLERMGFRRIGTYDEDSIQFLYPGMPAGYPDTFDLLDEIPSPSDQELTDAFARRGWKDSTGRHEIEARFVGLRDGAVQLYRADDRVIDVPIERLSKADQTFALEAALAQAHLWQEGYKTDEAIAILRAVVAVDDDNSMGCCVKAYLRLGTCLLREEKIFQAVACLKAVVGLTPENASGHNNRGVAWLAAGFRDEAVEDFTEAIRLKPTCVRYHVNRGVAYNMQREYDKAIADFNRAVELDPKCHQAYGSRGISWSKKDQLDKALADFNKALELDSGIADYYRNRAGAWEEQGEFGKAIDDCSEAIRLNPEYAAYYVKRCGLQRSLVLLQPKNAGGPTDMGTVKHVDRSRLFSEMKPSARNQLDKAIADISVAIRLDDKHPEYYTLRASLLLLQRRGDEVFEDCKRAIALDPGLAESYALRGQAWSLKEDPAACIFDLSKAIDLGEASAVVYGDRGGAWVKQQEFDRAIADCTEAVRIDPTYHLAYFNRATAWIQKGDGDKALVDLDKTLELDPTYEKVYARRSGAWLLKGDTSRALADLEKVAPSDSLKWFSQYMRLCIHLAVGDREKARAEVAQVPRVNPQIELALEELTKSLAGPCQESDIGSGNVEVDRTGDDQEDLPVTRRSITPSKSTTYFTGPLQKDGTVDYEAALNERYGAGVAQKDNAAALLCELYGSDYRLGLAEGEWKRLWQLMGAGKPPGDHFWKGFNPASINRLFSSLAPLEERETEGASLWRSRQAVLFRPWSQEQFPNLASWFDDHKMEQELLVEASRCSRYYVPMLPDDEGRPMAGVFVPLIPGRIGSANLLGAHAMLQLHEGRVDEAWEEVAACCRLGRLIGQGPTAYHADLSAGFVDAAAAGVSAISLDLGLSSWRLRSYQAEWNRLAFVPSFREKLDCAERCAMLDCLARVATRGPRGFVVTISGVGSLSGHGASREPVPLDSGLNVWYYNESIDWNEAARIGNAWFDRMVAVLDEASRARRVEAARAFDMEFRAVSETSAEFMRSPEVTLPFSIGIVPHSVRAQEMAMTVVSLTAPALLPLINVEDNAKARNHLAQIALALAVYRCDHGRYPDRLTELSPEYIKTLPDDPFSDKPFVYEGKGERYLLYSIGRDGKDDGSRWDDRSEYEGDDIRLLLPSPDGE